MYLHYLILFTYYESHYWNITKLMILYLFVRWLKNNFYPYFNIGKLKS